VPLESDAPIGESLPSDIEPRVLALQGAIARATHGLAYERALCGWFDDGAMLAEARRAVTQLAEGGDEAAKAIVVALIAEAVCIDSLDDLPPGSVLEWQVFATTAAGLAVDDPALYGWWRAIVTSVFSRPRPDAP